MAFSTINILAVGVASNSVSNSNVFTITITTSDYESAKQAVQQLYRSGGAFALDSSNLEVWIPTSNMLRVTVS